MTSTEIKPPRMPLIYIAGPFSAPTPEGIELNVKAAEAVACRIISATDRVAVLIPHSIGRSFALCGTGSDDYWYAATMRMCMACDAIVMCPGWIDSAGSVREHTSAADRKIPIYYSAQALIDAVDQGVWAEPR